MLFGELKLRRLLVVEGTNCDCTYTYNVPISLEVATNEDTGVTLNKICRQADRFEMIRKL